MQNRNLYNKILTDRLNQVEKKIYVSNEKPKAKPIETYTLLFSIIAICVSVVNMYFQFFYEKKELSANFVDFSIINDTTLVSTIIYHNKGNQNETILSNTIFFYQDSAKMENERIIFSPKSKNEIIHIPYDPVVLNPGQQLFKELKQPFSFLNLGNEVFNLNLKDTVKIGLDIGFINSQGLHSSNILKIGWLTLDKQKNVEYWQVDYKTKSLESTIYTSSTFVRPKTND